MPENKLVEIVTLSGQIEVVTGLRIGGSQETMEISGLDNPIIRNPRNAEPYIPGSSLKGRMRSLSEWYFDELPEGGEVIRVDPRTAEKTTRVFGMPAKDPKNDEFLKLLYDQGPTRLIVRDSILSANSREELRLGRPLSEVKTENSINRLTSMANPRPIERVLPGVRFDLDLIYRVFSIDGDGGTKDRELFDSVVLIALALVEADALGGGSSRGNGKVRILDLKKNGVPLALPSLQLASAGAT